MEFISFHFPLSPFPAEATSGGARDHPGNLRVLGKLYFKLIGALMTVCFIVMFTQHTHMLLMFILYIDMNYPFLKEIKGKRIPTFF